MYKLLALILLLILFSGCSTTKEINVPDSGITVIDYGADRRGAYLLKDSNGTNGDNNTTMFDRHNRSRYNF